MGDVAESGRLSCVVIGLNNAKTLVPCLESLKASDVGRSMEIIYVDGGSSDGSQELAESVSGVKVIMLNHDNPTAGRSRNAGWRASSGDIVHFLDGDMVVEDGWLRTSVSAFVGKIAAVFGDIRELQPKRNWYHRAMDAQFISRPGNGRYFSGMVAIRRTVLEETGGYCDAMIRGEDWEMSSRVRRLGYELKHLDQVMCHHHIDMSRSSEYFRRCFFTGYGMGENSILQFSSGELEGAVGVGKVLAKAGASAVLVFAAWIYANPYLLLSSVILNAIPVFQMPYLRKKHALLWGESWILASHRIISTYPVALGCLGYYAGRLLGRPLKNRKPPVTGADRSRRI